MSSVFNTPLRSKQLCCGLQDASLRDVKTQLKTGSCLGRQLSPDKRVSLELSYLETLVACGQKLHLHHTSRESRRFESHGSQDWRHPWQSSGPSLGSKEPLLHSIDNEGERGPVVRLYTHSEQIAKPVGVSEMSNSITSRDNLCQVNLTDKYPHHGTLYILDNLYQEQDSLNRSNLTGYHDGSAVSPTLELETPAMVSFDSDDSVFTSCSDLGQGITTASKSHVSQVYASSTMRRSGRDTIRLRMSAQLDLELERLERMVSSLDRLTHQFEGSERLSSSWAGPGGTKLGSYLDGEDGRCQVRVGMDRGRPSRSGIPTPVSSAKHQHVYSTPDKAGLGRKGRESPSRKGRSSPKPSSHAHHLHGTAYERRHRDGWDQSYSANTGTTNGSQSSYQSPRHLRPSGLVPVTTTQDESMLERSVVGCESSSDPYADPANLVPAKSVNFPRPDGQESLDWPEEASDNLDSTPVNENAKGQCSSDIACRSAEEVKVHGNQQYNQSEPPPSQHLSLGSEVTPEGVNGNTTGSLEYRVETDYPIRGTISPLTSCSKVAVKRSVGPVDEVSFVFGRPSSPGTDPNVTPRYAGSGYPRNRCVTASGLVRGARELSRKSGRPRSPSSDVLPQRRGLAVARASRRVLSPPPALGVGSAGEARLLGQGRPCCEQCNSCLVELKRQALRLMFPDSGVDGHLAQSIRVDNVAERLTPPEPYDRWYSNPRQACAVCGTGLVALRQEAAAMVQSIQLAHTSATAGSGNTALCGVVPHYRARLMSRQANTTPSPLTAAPSPSSSLQSPSSSSTPSAPLAVQAQAYLEQNVRAYLSPRRVTQMPKGRPPIAPSAASSIPASSHHQQNSNNDNNDNESLGQADTSFSDISSLSSLSSTPSPHKGQFHAHHHQYQQHQQQNYQQQQQQLHPQWPGYAQPVVGNVHYIAGSNPHPTVPYTDIACGSPASPPPASSAAVSFFARAAQKLGKKKKRHHSLEHDRPPPPPTFPTRYSEVIRLSPPPAPPCLLRTVGRLQNPGMGKVKVMLKICTPSGGQGQGEQGSSFLSADPRKKQVTVFDPSASGYVTSANRKAGTSAPKMFAFDSVFTPDDSLTEVCAGSLTEIVQAVVAGADGCLFTYGYSRLGKTYTMLGSDQAASKLGVMPCAVAWLFRLINEQKDKTGARFSVRVSAVQLSGRDEKLRDLLADIGQGTEATGVGAAPSVYLREDPICGTQLENQSELRAPTAEKAAFYLDAALAARTAADEEEARSSHLLFTLNVYQYRIEKANTKAGLPGVAGGRSRLHLIDLGTTSKSKEPNNVCLSLSALGNVVMALLNGQRHVPHRDSKIAQLLRDSLGNLSCRTCMIAHVSSAVPHYNESLQVIQLAARIHRMKRRRTKFSSTSSEDSSTDGDVKFRRPYRGMRMGTLREDVLYLSSHSDPDYTSSSEQSCDTVIYIGANGQSLSDRELTDNEGPPRHVPRTNPRVPRRPSGSRSSGDDSDSGRSVRSVRSVESGRLPVRRLMSASPTLGSSGPPGLVKIGAQSMPGSPKPGLVKMAHRMGVQTKFVPSDGSSLSMAEGRPTKMHCHSSQSKLAKAIHDKKEPMPGEQWIDGPGAAIYPEPANSELWVDGPDAFVVQHQPLAASTVSAGPVPTPSSSSAGQQTHHRADSSTSSSSAQHHHHHRSDSVSSRSRATSKKVNSEEHWVDGPREMLTSGSAPSQPMYTTCKTGDVVSKPGLHHPPKQAMSTGLSDKALKQALTKHILETKDKPESHQSADSSSSLNAEAAESRPVSFTSSEEQQLKNLSSHDKGNETYSTLSGRKPRLPEKHGDVTSSQLSPDLKAKSNKPELAHAPRLQKSQLPGSSSPTHRVAQWIKSVANEQGQAQTPVVTDQPTHVPVCSSQPQLTPEQGVAMADAETNTEHDSDFERMAAENGLPSSSSDESPGHCPQAAIPNSSENKCNNTSVMDTSLDSSFDNSLMMNAESIYEHEVEERLDFMKAKDGSRLAADVDNETFSSQSCSHRDCEEVDRDAQVSEIESVLVQHTKALTESRQTAQIDRHLARAGKTCAVRETSPGLSDYGNNGVKEVCRPLINRKPDGASNPNLTELCFEEGNSLSRHRQHLYQNPVDTMFVTNSDTPTSVKDSVTTLCDNNHVLRDKMGVEEELGAGEGMARSASNDKPPLPGRQVLCTVKRLHPSSVNTTPSASRSIYCTAKPVHQSNVKESLTSSASKLSSPKSKSKLFRGADKPNGSPTCSSSSGISSATSSPLVSSSTASKSSSSSPAAVKSLSSGPSSKLPSRTTSISSKDKVRKKDKEKEGTKGMGPRNIQLASSGGHKMRGNDSDSGNDSGIFAHEQRLLSPYATVTKPRTQSHSSSGHGSDNSTISTEVHPGHTRPGTKTDTLHGAHGGGGTSSGYESMLRDSEAGTSSGHEESGSESSTDRNTSTKRPKGARRSRSAPARSPESSPASSSQPSQAGSRSAGPAHRAWVDTRHLDKIKDEPLELKTYDTEEVERLGRRRMEESEGTALLESRPKNGSLKADDTTVQLIEHDRIEVERNGWSFDCKMLLCFSCKSNSKQPVTDV